MSKERKFWNFFLSRFGSTHCPLHFPTSTLIFWKRFCRIRLLFAHLHLQGRNWPGPILGGRKIFAFSMAPQCWLGDGIWSVRCIQFSDGRLLIFPLDFGRKFVENSFQTRFLHYLACLKVMHITQIAKRIEQCVQQWVLTKVSNPSQLFSSIYCQKLAKSSFSSNVSTHPKTI